MRWVLGAGLLFTGLTASAQTYVIGDAWIQGGLSAGTTEQGARLEVRASSVAASAFLVSGVDETPFIVVLSSGDAGMGTKPAARLDLIGSGDVDNAALILRNGDLYLASGRAQLTLGENGSPARRHAIRSVHLSSTAANGLEFLLWRPAQDSAAVGSLNAMSLVTSTAGAGSLVHVMPVGSPAADLAVSNGDFPGGGTVHCSTEVTPSSRDWKTDISPLGEREEDEAAREVAALGHAAFRYKKLGAKGYARDRLQPLRRGLLFEEAPAVLRGPGGTLVLDERLNELELAAKSLLRRLEAAQKEAGP